jgi:FAD:protein FMN transferase
VKKIPRHASKYWLTGAAAGLATLVGGDRVMAMPWVNVSDLSLRRAAPLDRFGAGYENVLGTSLDLIIEAARPADAVECEARLLGEIERLRRILSTYDPASEISRVMAGAPVVSTELTELLAAYESWNLRTGGLIDVNLGGVVAEWRQAALTGRLPARDSLTRAARRPLSLNVDALGKGFIIDRAVQVARRFAPGGVINLGGDLRAWGDAAWLVSIADPRNPAENASSLASFRLREAAVATSGGYARYYDFGGKRLSHLIDPRTQWPVDMGGSATVVAQDSVTANALSTAASIAGAAQGEALAQANGAQGYFLADSAGRTFGGGVLAAAAAVPIAVEGSSSTPAPTPAPNPTQEKSAAAPAEANWPEGFQVDIQVALKKLTGPRTIYRPYVVVWIQNAKGFLVRTITLWGEDSRYQRKLSSWWRVPREGAEEPQITARATRAAGAYTVMWDGKDDFGHRVPTGDYSICLEICREDGHHVVESVAVTCASESATAAIRETAESDASTVSYGPKKS